jgi:hypothetical protein
MESVQAESSVKLAALQKCAHPDCICTVGAGERYCSDYCLEDSRANSAMDVEGCKCGHPECGAGTHAVIPPVGTIAA